MKKIIVLLVLIFSITIARAQGIMDLSTLLTTYYNIKNALVSGDAARVSTNAAEFVKALNKADTRTLTAAEQKAFQSVQAKLAASAKIMAETKDISKQRESFSGFSNSMISLAGVAKLSVEPIYVDYCPMKKSYWLSAEKPIKNPYYGNSMLTCGSVKDTIK